MKLAIIQSKLRIPIVNNEYIRRASLTKKMKKIPDYSLTIIHSGAGYGKSTALSLYIRDERIPACWYSIASMDDDILPYLSYLIHAIREVIPEFGEGLTTYIDTIDRFIREEEIHFLCSLFINEIMAVNSEIILVLDDFHQIEHSYTINSWMEKLLDHIPSNLHIVISSRSRPSWKRLTKMKACGHLQEISREDLVLTLEEIDLLLTDLYGLRIESKHLQTIYQMTEGWIIALCMIAQQMPGKTDISDLFKYTTHSLEGLFQYLASEVFSKQPPMIQQFLKQTSIFEEIEEEMCNEVIAINGASSILEELKGRNLFLQEVGMNQYRYHALFKEFLENAFRIKQPNNFIQLHKKCARIFEKREMWEEALYHYNKIDHYKAIASILQENGIKLLESGKLESLHEQLKKIPEREMETHYFLWYLKAEVYRYRSQYQAAMEFYHKVYDRAEKNSDYYSMSISLEGKAQIYLDTIQPQNAEKLLYDAISKRERCRKSSDKDMLRLYVLLSENLLNSGKSSDSVKWLQKVKLVDSFTLEGNLEPRLFLRTGRFEEAKKILYARKQELAGRNFSSLPQSHRETELLLSLIEGLTGEGEKAKELAQEGIQEGISLKAPYVEACGWIRMGHAVQILNKYDIDLAEKCYETALEIMEQLNINRGTAEPLMGLCILFGTKGEPERAIEAGKKALQETEKACDVWLSALITLSMGMTCIYAEQLLKANEYLEKADALFHKCEDTFGQMLSKFWLSYVYYLEKKQDEFKKTSDIFFHLVQVHEYDFFFYKRSIFGPRDLQSFVPLLIECTKADIHKSYALKILQGMGITAFEHHPGYSIRVQTFGQFRVWLGEKEVGGKGWHREKAKELFQLLVTNEKPIQKDEIFQILWPYQDKQSADRDFKVALNTLHHVLEPIRKAREAPFFVVREGLLYGFNPLAVIELDTLIFQEWIQKGLYERKNEAAITFLEKGLSLYNGDYLSERRYDDWCSSKREQMLVYFLRGAEKLAQLNVRKELYDKAIYWCEKIIEHDRTWEEAYRLLMYCYYRKNNRPQSMKWYQKCTEVLEAELGVAPLEPTRHMYEMIVEYEKYIPIMEQP